MQQPDPSQLRISDADRHKVAELLRDAAAEGRLDLEELDERLEATYAARVYADLVPLTLDLPGPQASGLQPPDLRLPATAGQTMPQPLAADGLPISVHNSSVAIMSGIDRKGVWRVPDRHTAVSLMGGVTIDLRQALFTARHTVIHAHAIMGAVDIVVNSGTHVVVDGVALMGTFEEGRHKAEAEYNAAAPVVQVKGVALMGTVTVTRKPMPGERKRRKRLGG